MITFKLAIGAAAVAVVSALAAPAASAAPSADAATSRPWSVERNYPLQLISTIALSCSDDTHCWAAGSTSSESGAAIVATSDAGAHWTPQPLPPVVQALSGLSCVSATTCLAVGRDPNYTTLVVSTSNGGRTWTSRAVTSIVDGYGISCPSELACFIAGQFGVSVTSDGGRTWTNQSVPSAIGALSAIDCWSATSCTAVGSGNPDPTIVTTNGGTTWRARPVPGGATTLTGVSCASAQSCTAVGTGYSAVIVSTINGGRSWSNQTAPSDTYTLTGVSCPSVSVCIAGGYGDDGTVVGTDDHGATWSELTQSSSIRPVNVVACPSLGHCWAAGDWENYPPDHPTQLLHTTDGTAWTTQTITGLTRLFDDVDCADATHCVVSGRTAYDQGLVDVTRDDGRTWTSDVISAADELMAVSCPTALRCWAAGVATSAGGATFGAIFESTNGGITWTQQQVSHDAAFLGIYCVDTLACWAVGQDGTTIVATVDAGAHWKGQRTPSGYDVLSGITCVSDTTCWVVGSDSQSGAVIAKTTNGGKTWKDQPLSSQGLYGLNGISCASAMVCESVGLDEYYAAAVGTVDGGKTWTVQTVPQGNELKSVSCFTMSVCLATGGDSIIETTDGGKSWDTTYSLPSSPFDYPTSIDAVSCTVGLRCRAVGQTDSATLLLTNASSTTSS